MNSSPFPVIIAKGDPVNQTNIPGVEPTEASLPNFRNIALGIIILMAVVIINVVLENLRLIKGIEELNLTSKEFINLKMKDGSTFISHVHEGTATLFRFKKQTIMCAVLDEHKYSSKNKDR